MEDLSIHPRNHKTGHGKIKNTCAARSQKHGGQGGKPLRRVTKRLAARVKAWAAMGEQARSGCPKPGSMQP